MTLCDVLGFGFVAGCEKDMGVEKAEADMAYMKGVDGSGGCFRE